MARARPVVSVLTATIPGREAMLAECEASVRAQTTGRLEHLVRLDSEHEGFAATINALARDARGEYLLPLCDDDLLLPRCVESLLAHAHAGTVVYPKPLVWGEPDNNFTHGPPNIPSLALVPTALWHDLGGYNERLREREDLDLWERAVKAGVTFVRHDSSPTWLYRFWGGNKSRNGGRAK